MCWRGVAPKLAHHLKARPHKLLSVALGFEGSWAAVFSDGSYDFVSPSANFAADMAQSEVENVTLSPYAHENYWITYKIEQSSLSGPWSIHNSWMTKPDDVVLGS